MEHIVVRQIRIPIRTIVMEIRMETLIPIPIVSQRIRIQIVTEPVIHIAIRIPIHTIVTELIMEQEIRTIIPILILIAIRILTLIVTLTMIRLDFNSLICWTNRSFTGAVFFWVILCPEVYKMGTIKVARMAFQNGTNCAIIVSKL